MKKSIITDQIDMDFEPALKKARNNFEYVEIHSLWNKTIETLFDEELEEAEKLLEKYSMKVSCISSTLFLMCPLYTTPGELEPFSAKFKVFIGTKSDHLKMLERAVKISVRLNAPVIRVFPFRSEPKVTKNLSECMEDMSVIFSEAAVIAENEGKKLAIENCPHSYLPWGTMTHKLAEMVGRPGFGLLYDPGNSFRSGGSDEIDGFKRLSVPEEYNFIKDKVLHFHFKDYKKRGNRHFHIPLGDGDVGFPDLYAGIAAEGNRDVCVSLEPEVDTPGVERSIENFIRM